jgi:hypothetical protein
MPNKDEASRFSAGNNACSIRALNHAQPEENKKEDP